MNGWRAEMRQLCGDLLRRQYIIDCVRGNRISGHAGMSSCPLVLRESYPAFLLDCFHSLAAVRSIPGEDNRNGPAALHASQRFEKRIDRQVQPRPSVGQTQHSIFQHHRCIRRDDKNFVWAHCHAVFNGADRHRGGGSKNFGKEAFVMRIKVLHQNKRHAGIARKRLQ